MEKTKIIIDCDPGIDDTFALALAGSSDALTVLGITAVQGNVPLAHTARNALDLAAYFGIDCPVAKGAESPLARKAITVPGIHGDNGIGGAQIPAAKAEYAAQPAWDFIYETAKANGGAHLIPVGPLTNIAKLLQEYGDAAKYITHITIMGGDDRGGEPGSRAEFNVLNDPEAAKIVFDSGIPITMVGINATRQAFVESRRIRALGGEHSRIRPLLEALCEYMDTRGWEKNGKTLHDFLAVAYVIDPAVATSYQAGVECIVGGKHDGHTITKRNSNGGVTVLENVDRARFDLILERMIAYYG